MIVCDTIMIFFSSTTIFFRQCITVVVTQKHVVYTLVVIAQTSEVKLKCHELHATSNKFTVGSKSFVKVPKRNPD